jgi:uncharacterized membrane protein YccF (DUF307 family)
MRYYKDITDKIHALEDDSPRQPLPDWIEVTQEEGYAILNPVKSVEQIATLKNADINAWRLSASYSTFPYGGKLIACDALSRSDIDGVNGYVALNNALPAGFPGAWKATDNTYVTVADVATWKLFYAAMVATGAANFAHSQDLKAQMAAIVANGVMTDDEKRAAIELISW